MFAVDAIAPAANATPLKKSAITGKVSFATAPIDLSIEELPPKYQGHSVLEILQKIRPPRDKGEFEKTDEYEARIAHWKSLPILGSITPSDFLAFELSASMAPDAISVKYDADQEKLTTTVTFETHNGSGPGGWLTTFYRSKVLGSHIGVTSMNVKFRVKSHLGTSVGLSVGGVGNSQFSFSKSLSIDEARRLRPNLAAFAIVSLASPYKVDMRTTETASLTDPNEWLNQFLGLHVWLKAIWLVNQNTGEIILKNEGPFHTCFNYICSY